MSRRHERRQVRRRASRTPVGANEIGQNPSTAMPSLLEVVLRGGSDP